MGTRREFLKRSVELASLVAAAPFFELFAVAENCPTPSATAGPFFKEGAPFRTMLREPAHKGIPLAVSGTVIDESGKPVQNALVEVWHTDPTGDYDMDGFLYRASIRAKNNGEYGFKTFMPGAYSSRPQHIHYRITTPNNQKLTTQLYFTSDPWFEGDPEKTFERDPIITDFSLIRPVSGDAKKGYQVNFPICLKSV